MLIAKSEAKKSAEVPLLRQYVRGATVEEHSSLQSQNLIAEGFHVSDKTCMRQHLKYAANLFSTETSCGSGSMFLY